MNETFLGKIKYLKVGDSVAVCDYMMRLLFQKQYECQSEWYGKKGVSLHGTMFIYKSDDSDEISIEFHDTFSEDDDTQNWFFSSSCIEESVRNFKSLHPHITSLSLWSDNGPHYKNTSLILWLRELTTLTGIKLTRFSNFEAQKGKTQLDSHYGILKFALRRYIKEGHNVICGKDITQGTEGRLRGTHVYPIHIDRNKEPASAKTLKGISNYGDFSFNYDNIH